MNTWGGAAILEGGELVPNLGSDMGVAIQHVEEPAQNRGRWISTRQDEVDHDVAESSVVESTVTLRAQLHKSGQKVVLLLQWQRNNIQNLNNTSRE